MAGLITVEDARSRARCRWPKLIYDFVDGAAGAEVGAAMARSTISDLRLLPRVLVDIDDRRLDVEFLGRRYGVPFGIAPMGMCDLSGVGADLMMARLAKERELPLCLSTAASTTVEDVTAVAGANCWFQLYPSGDVTIANELVERAATAGCDTLILTVDVPVLGRRPRELRAGFNVPFRFGVQQYLDFALHLRWSLERLAAGMPTMAHFTSSGRSSFQREQVRGRVTMDYLGNLRKLWSGKLVVKGILSVEDALMVKDAGVDAVYVSGHGCRQLDSLPPPLYALAAIRDAVGPSYPLIFDSGVRSGEDIIKALAVGADFVMLGRPFLYGIGADGEQGLKTVANLLETDTSTTLAQLGLRSIGDVSRSVLSCWQPPGCPDSLRVTEQGAQ